MSIPQRIRPVEWGCPRRFFSSIQSGVVGALGDFEVVEDFLLRVRVDFLHPVPGLHLVDQFIPTISREMVGRNDRRGMAGEARGQNQFPAGTGFEAELFFDCIGRLLCARYQQRGQSQGNDHHKGDADEVFVRETHF